MERYPQADRKREAAWSCLRFIFLSRLSDSYIGDRNRSRFLAGHCFLSVDRSLGFVSPLRKWHELVVLIVVRISVSISAECYKRSLGKRGWEDKFLVLLTIYIGDFFRLPPTYLEVQNPFAP